MSVFRALVRLVRGAALLIAIAVPGCNPIDPPDDGLVIVALQFLPTDRGVLGDIAQLEAHVLRVDVVHRSVATDPSSERLITVVSEPATVVASDLHSYRPQILVRFAVQQGSIRQIRFVIDRATITYADGQRRSVRIPSGATSGLKLVPTEEGAELVEVRAQATSAVLATLDPDRRTLTNRGVGLVLKPTIPARSVDPAEISLFILDEVIVLFRRDASSEAISTLNAEISASILRIEPLTRMYLVRLPPDVAITDAIQHYIARSDVVLTAVPNVGLPAPLLPNDLVGEALAAMDAPRAWDTTVGTHQPVIAIIDDGFDLDHPDLIQNMWLNAPEVIAFVGDRNADGVADLADVDVDGDGVLTFRDLNHPALDGVCPRSRNPNSPVDVCDPLDLVDGDAAVDVGFENGIDDDCNGFVDDLVGWDYVDSDNSPQFVGGFHGTLVAGIAAAVGDNGPGGTGAVVTSFGGVAGTAWNARILPLRAQSELHSKLGALAVANFTYVADVAVFSGSISLNTDLPSTLPFGCAADRPPGGSNIEDWRSKLTTLWRENAQSCHTLVIAPSTNCDFDDDLSTVLTFPSEFHVENGVSMTGVDLDRTFAGLSNWGATSIEIAAIGQMESGGYPILVPDDRVLESAAGGHVSPAMGPFAGTAALVVSADPAWQGSACAIRRRLLENATPDVMPSGRVQGDRLLNIANAVENTAGTTLSACAFECRPRPTGCDAP